MSIHPNGSGTGWTNVETVDVDQPHGLDYRYSQHIAKGVRKRSNKQHVAFGDSTAGGEHLPGGCSILDIVDQTIDISIDDSTYVGRNLIYDQTNSVFWCFTNTDYTTSTPSAYKLMMGPKSICLGGDFTWTGAHEFDTSVDISGNVALDGDLTVDGVLKVDSSADFSDIYINGDLSMTGTLKVATDFTLTGDMAVDGTSNFYDEADFSAINTSSTAIGFMKYSGAGLNGGNAITITTGGTYVSVATGLSARALCYIKVQNVSGGAGQIAIRDKDESGDWDHDKTGESGGAGKYYCDNNSYGVLMVACNTSGDIEITSAGSNKDWKLWLMNYIQ